MFVIAYPRETQEMAMDAHNRAFAVYGGVPQQVIYDNLKTVVDCIFVGKERQFNRRFMALANHYLFEPVACTPAAGWEKGQIEIKSVMSENGCLRREPNSRALTP
ncbi:MAG: hypothetical protein ACU833_06140 [Gammaproteobacteria bacterium]